MDYDEANSRLHEAWSISQSDVQLPEEWLESARWVFYSMRAKTYAAALGTALLAKATDDQVDSFSIKAKYIGEETGGLRTFSLRTLGHKVLVPGSVELGFSLRATGREPLNNQPFFRYDHVSLMTRVLNQEELDLYIDALKRAQKLTKAGALIALAAFLRVADQYQRELDQKRSAPDKVSPPGEFLVNRLLADLPAFVAPGVEDRPARIQALAAAGLDLCHRKVTSRRLNDPSRDLPGDVTVFIRGQPIMVLEARGKPVPLSELRSLAVSCASRGISRVMLLVDAPGHTHITLRDVQEIEGDELVISVFECVQDFVHEALAWSENTDTEAAAVLVESTVARLREIEVSEATVGEWLSLVYAVRR